MKIKTCVAAGTLLRSQYTKEKEKEDIILTAFRNIQSITLRYAGNKGVTGTTTSPDLL